MTAHTIGWELKLLSWAEQCLEQNEDDGIAEIDETILSAAYRTCAEITAVHSRTFHMASALLPENKRRAVRALYAFCRRTDDLVDSPERASADELGAWRARMLLKSPETDDLVALAWEDTRYRFRVPRCYIEQFLEGVSRDLTQTRYATFDDVAQYCYGVASTVGLMVSHIIGFSGPEAIPYAVKLGVALQITNILRDIGEDWRTGRLYLAQEELEAFGISESDIDAQRVTSRWRTFMNFQVERNRRLYAEAWPGIAMLNRDGRFAIGAAAILYQGILDDIEWHGGDVFSRRSHVGTYGKLRRLPYVWWRVKQSGIHRNQTELSERVWR